MPAPIIAVIDTGICNLRSVTKAVAFAGGVPQVVRTPEDVTKSQADGLVLPGVGALRDCVASLRASRLADIVGAWIKENRPFLGVCLGMQALFDRSEEGAVTGLGVFSGEVVRFRRPADVKIPHMGWNTLRFVQPTSPLSVGLASSGEAFYFVHSFHCVPEDTSLVLGVCDYSGEFCAAIGRGNVYATQFHPEKSQSKGIQVYRNFVDLSAWVAV